MRASTLRSFPAFIRRQVRSQAARMVTAHHDASSRGALIVFEGVDRCGKSTQAKLLVEALKQQQVPAQLWRYPNRSSASGKVINSYLLSQHEMDVAAMHLTFAANRREDRAAVEALLLEGMTVVVDRYAFSGVAYTAAKAEGSLSRRWLKAPDAGLVAPDAVLFLRIPPEAAAKRGEYGKERYERIAFQAAVHSEFEALQDSTWKVLDADQSPEALHTQVMQLASTVVEACRAGAPLARLWPELE